MKVVNLDLLIKEIHCLYSDDLGIVENIECLPTTEISQWIPIKQSLPTKTDEYLCTVEWYGTSTKKLLIQNGHTIETRLKMVYYLDSHKQFKEQDGCCRYKVIAWKDEQPYKKGE